MQTFIEAILKAENISGRNAKSEVLKGFSQIEQRLVKEALDPFRVFGVKKFDNPTQYASQDADANLFLALLDNLHDRVLTGNAARNAVSETLSKYTERTASVLVRIIGKDLKCGATESTFNDIYPNLVPVFEVQTCAKVEDPKKHKFFFPCRAEAKYDGQRVVAMVFDGAVTYLSGRSGKPADFCDGLFDEELLALHKKLGDFVLDGEVMGKNFLETMNAKGGKKPGKGKDAAAKAEKAANAKGQLLFKAFDLLSREEWDAKKCDRPQHVRSDWLESLINEFGFKKIVLAKYKICHTMDELHAFYAEVLEDGDEGLILKHMEAMYEWIRSKLWVKWKPVIDLDLRVVGFYEGKAGTKNEGILGGFYLEGTDENGNFIKTECGSIKVNPKKNKVLLPWLMEQLGDEFNNFDNIDQAFRTFVWKNQTKLEGLLVKIECQELSKSEGSEHYSARFPIFICFRTDKVA